MKKGLLIYNPEDYEKNKWFVKELLTKAPKHGLELYFILRNQLMLSIDELGSFAAYALITDAHTIDSYDLLTTNPPLHTPLEVPDTSKLNTHLASSMTHLQGFDFVINRTRDSIVGSHFEKMNCRVFNSSYVTEICNHKGKTHELINSQGISSVSTLPCNAQYFNPSLIPFDYPMILKSVGGHGGNEVFLAKDEISLLTYIHTLSSSDFILQALCTNPGIDIRVFTLGKEIIASVKRFCTTSFKSNYSLGGSAVSYQLAPHEEKLVYKILDSLETDFVGIDFILDQNGKLLFNEIEDVVGTRTLYLTHPDIDIVDHFLSYIQKTL